MHRRYFPQVYPGHLTLYLASDSFLNRDPAHDPRLEWKGLAQGGDDVLVVAGDHETLLRPPWVEDLAARLGHALRAGRTRG